MLFFEEFSIIIAHLLPTKSNNQPEVLCLQALNGVQLVILFCFRFSMVLFDFVVRQYVGSVESSSLNLLSSFRDLFVLP